MCYDVAFAAELDQLSDWFPDLDYDSEMDLNLEASMHIIGHAYGLHPIIYKNKNDQQLHCRLMEWGCIPYYVKEEKSFLKQRASMLNARSERIMDDQKSYWYKIRNRRCLIPVSGIYEHRAVAGWKKKVPYFITLNAQPLFFIPGLFSVAQLPDTSTGEVMERWTFTLVTREANELMSQIHNDGPNKGRMPLFLPFEMSKKWIADELSDDQIRELLAYEMPSDQLDNHPVYTIRTPKTRPDNQPKTAYWEWEKLPPLGQMNLDDRKTID